ncbi:hypothetical protein FH832_002820 [Listeria monocytogenes]|nr:hypothetical protein [Listeria monocytogenes]
MAKLNGVKTLDMVNGEVTKVEYDGVIYEAVGKKDGKAGDLGLRIAANASHAKIGEFYKVVDKVGAIGFKDDEGDTPKIWEHQENFAYFRKVAEPLKVGDYVKIINEIHGHGFDIGDIVKLTDEGFDPNFESKRVTDDIRWYVSEEEVVRATEEDVSAFKAKEAQRKLEAKWAKIGRKPNEFKSGDIVRVVDSPAAHPEGSLVEVQTVSTNASLTANGYLADFARSITLGYALDDVELITPVEARFDR